MMGFMLMDTGLMAMLRKLKLTQTATDVLSVMIEFQEPGGAVLRTQPEIAAELGIHRTQVSRAMSLLVRRGLVLRNNNGRGRSYALNPVIAGYESEDALVHEMDQLLAADGPPKILLPDYRQAPPREGRANLTSVA